MYVSFGEEKKKDDRNTANAALTMNDVTFNTLYCFQA